MPIRRTSDVVNSSLNRRSFLKTAGAAAMLPAFRTTYGAQSSGTPANNRINLGVIGMNWQGPANTKSFLALDDCQVVAACDLDKNHLNSAVQTINDHYQNQDCKKNKLLKP